jgi:hypothetical protein
MNHSGDAAEQIVRMSLEGVEVACKITGSAAKEIAILIIAALKNDNKDTHKLKGKARLASMLKSGKPLEIFSVKETDLKKFVQGAKKYGIVYCVLKNAKGCPDGLCDIMVKADDAPKISRLVERLKFATVDKAKIENEIVADKAAKAAEARTDAAPVTKTASESAEQPEAPDLGDNEKLLDELLGIDEGKAEQEPPKPEKTEPVRTEPVNADKGESEINPLAESGRSPADTPTPTTPPSAPTSERRKKPERTISSKPSVREELRGITTARKKDEQAKRNERPEAERPKDTPAAATHKQPQRSRKPKSKSKGSR